MSVLPPILESSSPVKPVLFPCPVIRPCVIFILWEVSVPGENCSCDYEAIRCPLGSIFSLQLNTKLPSSRNGFSWNVKEEKEGRIYLTVSVVTEFLSVWIAGKIEDGIALPKDSVVLLGEGRPQSQWSPKQVLGMSFLLSSPREAHMVDIHLTLFCETAYNCTHFTGVWSEINQKILGDILPQANNTSHTPVFSPTILWQEMFPSRHLQFLVLFLPS